MSLQHPHNQRDGGKHGTMLLKIMKHSSESPRSPNDNRLTLSLAVDRLAALDVVLANKELIPPERSSSQCRIVRNSERC